MRFIDSKDAEDQGYAVFNAGKPHLCVDVPDGWSTITCRMSNGKKVTFAFIGYEGASPFSVDIHHATGPDVLHQGVTHQRQDVICFSGGGPDPYHSRDKKFEGKPCTLVTLLLEEPPE